MDADRGTAQSMPGMPEAIVAALISSGFKSYRLLDNIVHDLEDAKELITQACEAAGAVPQLEDVGIDLAATILMD